MNVSRIPEYSTRFRGCSSAHVSGSDGHLPLLPVFVPRPQLEDERATLSQSALSDVNDSIYLPAHLLDTQAARSKIGVF